MLSRVFIILIVAAVAAIGLVASAYDAPRHQALSTVMVSDDAGHGSGVHIGSGFILTAAHVVEDRDSMTVTDSDGNAQAATVLWRNKAYDVALIEAADASNIATSQLACHPHLQVGQSLYAVGNPLNLKFVRTYGRVAALIEDRKPWHMSFIADMTIIPGMSGGPVFDAIGRVVGLAVGVSSMPNFAGVPALLGTSYIVPSDAVCLLLADARR